MGSKRETLLPILFSVAAFFPFLFKSFHIDDANFIAIAGQIRKAPLDPYSFRINWLGTEERAYDILANPPLVPYYIAMVSSLFGEREWVLRLSFFPFLLAAAFSFNSLVEKFLPGSGTTPTLILLSSPAFLLSSHFIMPDIPLLAIYLAGLALFIKGADRRKTLSVIAGSLLLGLAPLCRYSGVTATMIALFYTLLCLKRPSRYIPYLFIPILVFSIYSIFTLSVYGSIHPLHMTSFEAGPINLWKVAQILFAQVSYTGGTIIFPPLLFLLPRLIEGWAAKVTLLAGAALGLFTGLGMGYPPLPAAILSLFSLSGLLLIYRSLYPVSAGSKPGERISLVLWFLVPFLFNLFLLFASVRYILPLVPPLILLSFRGFGKRSLMLISFMNLLFSLSLAFSDYRFAGVYSDFVGKFTASRRAEGGEVLFAGHWGFQYYMEREGAKALDEENPDLSRGGFVLFPTYPWPQALSEEGMNRLRPFSEYVYPSRFPLRTVSKSAFASFFSHRLSTTPVPVFLPYGIGLDEYEIFSVFEVKR